MSDTVSANQAHFNKIANEYDEKFKQVLDQIEEELKENISILGIEKGGRLLDYACGTGLLTRSLKDEIGQCVGMDVSENMIEMYNARAATQGHTKNQMYAYLGNLFEPNSPSGPETLSGSEFFNFDAVGVGAGFHHFDDCNLAATRLTERLRVGGTLFILDFAPHEPLHNHSHGAHGVKYNGFTEAQVRGIFDQAGAGKDFVFKMMKTKFELNNAHTEGQTIRREMFLARGTKL